MDVAISRGKTSMTLSRRNRSWRVATLVAVMVGCGTPGKNLPVTEGTAVIDTDNIQEIHVRVESFYFEPSRIHVLVDIPVRMVLKSGTFIIPHNLSIDAPEAGIEIDLDIGHGKTATVEFTPTKEGEYPFFCNKGSHVKKGMTGTLVVEPRQ